MHGQCDLDVARSRSDPTNQTSDVATIAHAIARFGFSPKICVIRIRTNQDARLSAAYFAKASGDHHIAVGLNTECVNPTFSVTKTGAM